ncbi:hypothetical protein [Polaribacter ponticola]|uniref:Uncharacterized protein n=1 Tax=Polaribacter ponticola TaxID=2978475 RepID=A0ABT5S4W2_9FLAO|nr:hypothetical protein [Polaribacter sp. MSW5]MDD7913147.1 hypothetical protein [Polaribacter sp. MSW5]
MPRLLKNDTVRLIEASIESLGLAQVGICAFRRDVLKMEQVRYSPEIGLIGTSIELAMSSILIQALGKKSIYRDYKNAKYKTASEILSDFRTLLKQSSSNILFLSNGINNSTEHIDKILALTNRFQIIITGRANGLHNGYGLNYDLVASLFQNVSAFLKLVGLSNNFKPYLTKVPELVGIKIDSDLVINDLYKRFNETKSLIEQKSILSSLFLILPEIPKELPEWISKFESIKIAPKKTDVVYLINALEQANPVTLNKVTSSSNSLDVKIVGRDVEGAIPISVQSLKSEFTQIKDQFDADVASANGRLNKNKQLDLPPKTSIYNAFSFDLAELKILEKDKKFTAHQTWPFIIEAINISKNNTNAPYWFFIRKTNDLGQLKACIKKSSKYGNSSLRKNATLVLGGIEAIEKDEPIDTDSIFIQKLLTEINTLSSQLDKLKKLYKKNGLNGLTEDYSQCFEDLFNENISIGEVLEKIIDDETIDNSSKKYWIAKLTTIMPESQDLHILAGILNNNEYKNAHTNIRKAYRAFDFNTFGPKVKST